jgi:hypothetical protein
VSPVLVELLPWIFTQADVAIPEFLWTWPRSGHERRFKHLYTMLLTLRPGQKGIYENMETIDEKLNCDWKGSDSLGLFLSELTSEVEQAVEESIDGVSSFDQKRFYFR